MQFHDFDRLKFDCDLFTDILNHVDSSETFGCRKWQTYITQDELFAIKDMGNYTITVIQHIDTTNVKILIEHLSKTKKFEYDRDNYEQELTNTLIMHDLFIKSKMWERS